jgi:inorganic pyrophosphatase
MSASPRLDQLAPFGPDSAVRAVIEVPAGSRNKLKYDPALGAFVLHHVLPAGASFPCNFGFVPSTRGGDSDPLDVLVFADEPLPPGTIVPCRLVGVIEARQAREGDPPVRNDRLIAVATHSHLHRDWRTLGDLPASLLDELERFFAFDNAQRGQQFTPLGRHDSTRAHQLLAQGRIAKP